jgi:hypothetical protein
MRSDWLAVLKSMASEVPVPEVASIVTVELAAVPPISKGVVTEVPMVGAALNAAAPALAVRIEFAAPCAVICTALVPLP